MPPINAIIDRYNELALTGSLGQESWAVLAPGLQRRSLVFGERPLATVLRPLFHTRRGWDYLRERTELLLAVFRKLSDAMLSDPALRAQVRLTPDEEALLRLPSGYGTNIPTARLDSFFCRHADGRVKLSFVEFNGESPAGMAYGDVLAEAFAETPLMQRFAQEYRLEPICARANALDALLRIYYEWRGNRSRLPVIAIVDWEGVPTASEFRLFADYFGRHGISSIICSPQALDYRNGQMFADGVAVDLIYKRVLISELLARYGLDHPIVRALGDGAICMANPFNCKVLHKKASFAVASDERNAHLLSAPELAAVREHIPWTRVVEERFTLDAEGRTIDLVPWVSHNKNHLVLKPNDEYGGSGVVIGWEVTGEEWNRALAKGLEEPMIVQERVEIAYELFPYVDVAGATHVGERLVDCDPFLFHGSIVGGCLVRLSSVTLLNVTAGGGSVVPAFIVDEP